MKDAEKQKTLVINCPVIVLVGPTAIGKTALSIQLVEKFSCEIISMDSMQVYRYMDIGTAKPSQEEMQQIPHHLINIVDPDDQYDAARFVRDSLAAIRDIEGRGRAALITGLYLKALVEGLFAAMPTDKEIRQQLQERLDKEGRAGLHAELCRIDPESGARIHKNDSQRLLRGLEIYHASGKTWTELLEKQKTQEQGVVFTRMYQAALTCEREQLYQRIKERSRVMVEQGLLEEVQTLHGMGYEFELASMQSIGYRHAGNLLSGIWNQEEMMEHLIRDTRRYAKRQMTWFRRNNDLNWFNREEGERVGEQIKANLSL